MALLSYPNGSIEPVAVADARVACRIDGLDLDGELAGLISAAREQAEHITGRLARAGRRVRRSNGEIIVTRYSADGSTQIGEPTQMTEAQVEALL